MLDAVSLGVEDAGGQVIRLIASEAGVSHCRGCNACSVTGECVIRDGMDVVRAQIDAADAVAVATPVYFATVPATLKALYDRFQPYWALRYVLDRPAPEPRRPGALVVVGGGGDPFGTGCAVVPTRSVLAVAGFSVDEVIEVVGPDSAGEIDRFSEAISRARASGADLVGRVNP
jgi:multimeric flavodoxin WrbA